MSSRVIRFLCRISFLLGACLAFAIATFAQAGNEPWKAQGIINTSASLKAKLHSVPIRAVTMGDGFWSERMRTNAEKSIPTLLGLLEEHGVVDNFRRLSGRKNAGRKGPVYTDSDLYKWMEAVAFVLQSGDRPQLRETLDKLIDDVLAAQEPSGYLNTYYVGDRAKLRFSEMTAATSCTAWVISCRLPSPITAPRGTGSSWMAGSSMPTMYCRPLDRKRNPL